VAKPAAPAPITATREHIEVVGKLGLGSARARKSDAARLPSLGFADVSRIINGHIHRIRATVGMGHGAVFPAQGQGVFRAAEAHRAQVALGAYKGQGRRSADLRPEKAS
jgi:hypothetical protein